jgi:hypothetical protein
MELGIQGETRAEVWKFPVSAQELFLADGTRVKNVRAIVRDDTGEPLSTVSTGYKIIEHDEMVTAIRPFMENLGKFSEDVSVGQNGKRMYASYTFKDVTQDVKKGDTVGLRLILQNSYVPGTSAKIIMAGLRLVCLNGMVSSINTSSVSLRHSKEGREKLEMPIAQDFIDQFKDNISFWSRLTNAALDMGTYDTKKFEVESPIINSLYGRLLQEKVVPVKHHQDIMLPLANKDATYWDFYNNLTRYITHESQVAPQTKIGRLRKVDAAFRDTYSFINN